MPATANRRFPGVDPYLESPAFEKDFHESFIVYAADTVANVLPDDYELRINERIILPALVTATMHRDEERTSFLEIHHRPTQKLITVIVLLSPANKTSPGFHDYLNKRKAILREPVHMVEFDFLIGGRRMPTRSPLPPGDCYALVSRFTTRPNAEVYAWTLRDRIPAIRVPLREPDPDLLLDLAAVYDETFSRGRYQRNLRYDLPPPVAMNPVATEWMASLS